MLKDLETLLLKYSQEVLNLINLLTYLSDVNFFLDLRFIGNFLLQHGCLFLGADQEQSEVRFCALRWATSLYDLQHCPSRFICMLGVADSKLDIR